MDAAAVMTKLLKLATAPPSTSVPVPVPAKPTRNSHWSRWSTLTVIGVGLNVAAELARPAVFNRHGFERTIEVGRTIPEHAAVDRTSLLAMSVPGPTRIVSIKRFATPALAVSATSTDPPCRTNASSQMSGVLLPSQLAAVSQTVPRENPKANRYGSSCYRRGRQHVVAVVAGDSLCRHGTGQRGTSTVPAPPVLTGHIGTSQETAAGRMPSDVSSDPA